MDATTEHIELILTGIGLMVVWVSSLIGFWIKIKIQLKELEMMIVNIRQNVSDRFLHNEDTLDKHITWGENQQMLNDNRFKELINDNKSEHKDLLSKMDDILCSLNDFKIYVEREIKK